MLLVILYETHYHVTCHITWYTVMLLVISHDTLSCYLSYHMRHTVLLLVTSWDIIVLLVISHERHCHVTCHFTWTTLDFMSGHLPWSLSAKYASRHLATAWWHTTMTFSCLSSSWWHKTGWRDGQCHTDTYKCKQYSMGCFKIIYTIPQYSRLRGHMGATCNIDKLTI